MKCAWICSVTSMMPLGAITISASNFWMRSSFVEIENAGPKPERKKNPKPRTARHNLLAARNEPLAAGRDMPFSGRGRLRGKADLGRFALGRRADFKEFTRFEAEHAGEDVRRELLDFGVQVADDRVVIAPRVLHGVLDLGEGILQGSEAFDGAQLRIGLGKSEEALERAREHVFGLGSVGGAGGGHGAVACVDDCFECSFFVSGINLLGLDWIGRQGGAAVPLLIDMGQG